MKNDSEIIQKAEFNPQIKKYILFSVPFIMLATVIGIPLIPIWFLGLGQYVGKRYYENLFCSLTPHHLRFKKGVFFKVEKTIPLENIQDLTFKENPILNYLDLKILKVETAGNSSSSSSDMTLIGLIDASEFKDKVLGQLENLRNKSQITNLEKQDQHKISDLLVEIRDILNEIKNK